MHADTFRDRDVDIASSTTDEDYTRLGGTGHESEDNGLFNIRCRPSTEPKVSADSFVRGPGCAVPVLVGLAN
ncbi:uncharacterized protein SPSK_04757 [Sporothrix schenckii 1099-18]|uniref:Uncharacterized protein n=1 Tax=Sporothrix schenckii 1099-18 TaxID=1397361 RepID=A0A0F2M6K6_SPOSC|nr:uncharacterized protein SPSK_04757 [Sporothrix schenckii 1099-18]KJR83821.1 hypothetical protein SPSK_04757 [Sporothrix schenckii 1099-18]